ncbi:MAG: cadherin-like domain-containing protein, partial [Planctomycetales bacterium]|nr:cadherin-like domain-containing protein [Planctomycetales bacterium]
RAESGSIGVQNLSLANMEGILYFSADDGIHGSELWLSDGTEDGTVLVRDIRAGANSSQPSEITYFGGALYFAAHDDPFGRELWKSDGTEGGTTLLKDIRPGGDSSHPTLFTQVGELLYFVANDGDSGYELWKSDGTPEGTVFVKDINTGTLSSNPRYLTDVNGTLYFAANDGVGGVELWKSDGSEAGTVRVKDIRVGTNGSIPRLLTNMNGLLYFTAHDGVSWEIWKSDGTEAGTSRVKSNRLASGALSPVELANVGGTLYFTGFDGNGGLWKSDGTDEGTIRVHSTGARNLTNVYGTLYFTAYEPGDRHALWQSDGTEAGTIRINDIGSGTANVHVHHLTTVAGLLFFVAYDEHGRELWMSDGTESGTLLVEDLTGDSGGASPEYITEVGNRLFFVAQNDLFGRELWTGVIDEIEFAPGDFDGNGVLDALDIDALVAAIARREHPPLFDLTLDSLVDEQDLSRWLQLAGAANLAPDAAYDPGDANLDGVVDMADFAIWNTHKFTAVASWSLGDFNADGVTDISDLNLWNTHRVIPHDPVANPDELDTFDDEPLLIAIADLLENDTDPDPGDTVSFVAVDSTSQLGATITMPDDASIFYDPTHVVELYALRPGQQVVDTFEYMVTDDSGLTARGTVHVTVHGVDIVTYSYELTDLDGNPLTEVTAGSLFQIRGTVADTSSIATGVGAAYVNLTFDPTRATVTSIDITLPHLAGGAVTRVASDGSAFTVGGLQFTDRSADPLPLSTTTFLAGTTPGIVTITPGPSPFPDIESTLTLGSEFLIPTEQIAYGSIEIPIVAPSPPAESITATSIHAASTNSNWEESPSVAATSLPGPTDTARTTLRTATAREPDTTATTVPRTTAAGRRLSMNRKRQDANGQNEAAEGERPGRLSTFPSAAP